MANVVSKQSVYLVPDSTVIVGGQAFYKEDANGYIPASKITYDNGNVVLVVYLSFVAPTSFEGRIIRTMCQQYLFDTTFGHWSPYDTNKFNISGNYSYMQIDDNTYINTTTGTIETDPYEDDLTKPIYAEDGTTITGYEQKLKANVESEYSYWLRTLGKPVIFPAMQSAGNNKF